MRKSCLVALRLMEYVTLSQSNLAIRNRVFEALGLAATDSKNGRGRAAAVRAVPAVDVVVRRHIYHQRLGEVEDRTRTLANLEGDEVVGTSASVILVIINLDGFGGRRASRGEDGG